MGGDRRNIPGQAVVPEEIGLLRRDLKKICMIGHQVTPPDILGIVHGASGIGQL